MDKLLLFSYSKKMQGVFQVQLFGPFLGLVYLVSPVVFIHILIPSRSSSSSEKEAHVVHALIHMSCLTLHEICY